MLDTPVDELPPVRDYAWNRLFSRGTIPATMLWLLALTLMGVASYPIAYLIFARFADRGYLLGKTLALLLVSYLTWLPASLGLWRYTVWSVVAAIAALGAASLLLLHQRGITPAQLWKENRPVIWRCEILFLIAFGLGLLLRLGNPDTWHPVTGGEKPMEFGFLNAILRSPTMPPLDPFFSGGYINYYYYGLFAVSTLIKLTGLMPAIGFNLVIATLFALTAAGAFAVAATLAKGWKWGILGSLFTVFIGPLSGAVPVRGRGGYGEVLDAVQRLADPQTQGALARTWQGFWRWLGSSTLPLRTDWFWDASRSHGYYENTITEFPFWSFLFADLHPHTINIPFTILVIALAFRLTQAWGAAREADERSSFSAVGIYLLSALALGGLSVTNSWDFPTFFLLCVGALLVGHLLSERLRQRPPMARVGIALAAATLGGLLLGTLSLALYLPFFTHFQAFVKGIGQVTYPTEINYYLGFFGFFLLIIGAYALWGALHKEHPRRGKSLLSPDAPASPPKPHTPQSDPALAIVVPLELEEIPLDAGIPSGPDPQACALDAPPTVASARRLPAIIQGLWAAIRTHWLLVSSVLLLLLVTVASTLYYPSTNLRQIGTLWLICELILLSITVAVRYRPDHRTAFVLWLAVVGLLVALGVEAVYIRDHLGGAWYRMNTIFKFYVHTWVLLALAAASALGLLAKAHKFWTSNLGMAWRGLLLALAIPVFIYPIFATQSRWRERFPVPPPWGTLDGLAYMRTATYSWDGHALYLEPDYEAILWLIDNLEGTPVVHQAPYGFYRENGVRIAVNTGYPTILNPLHANEQRYDELIGPRHRDAEEIYRTTDANRAAELLAKYRASYVYVGPFERAIYRPEGLAKFEEMLGQQLDLIYDENGVRIYRVRPETLAMFGGYLPESARPVTVPTVQPRPAPDLERDALRALERAAAASPENAGLQFDLGDRYRRLGRHEDAIQVFQRSLQYNPDDVAMYHTLGDTYAHLGQLDQALAQYQRAVEIASTAPAAHNKLGMAYMDRERWTDAIGAFQRAVEYEPAFVEARFHMGTAYERLGNLDQARNVYLDVGRLGPETDWAFRAAERLQAIGN